MASGYAKSAAASTESAVESPAPLISGLLWKKSPGVHRQLLGSYQQRHVMLSKRNNDDVLTWFKPNDMATPQGSLNLRSNTCIVEPDSTSDTHFVVRPGFGETKWVDAQFTGANEGRHLLFDAKDSEHPRERWIEVIKDRVTKNKWHCLDQPKDPNKALSPEVVKLMASLGVPQQKNEESTHVKRLTGNKLVLHFDVNGTIIAVDPASGQDLRMVVNTFLAGACWGKDVAGKWEWSTATMQGDLQLSCPADAEISYYKYLEGCMTDQPRSEFKSAVGSFAETHETFRKAADDIVSALVAPESLWDTPFALQQDGVWYHFIFPGVWKLFASLQEEGRQFSVVVRTFGTDGPEIAKAINAFACGQHPDYPSGCSNLHLAGQGTLTLDETTGMQLALASEDQSQVTLQGEVDIFSYLQTLSGTLVLRDDYQWWAKHSYAAVGGKPTWLLRDSPADSSQHIFFDDNFRADMPASSIVDSRVMVLSKDTYEAGGSIDPQIAEAAGCVVTANLARSVLDVDHFNQLVKQAESKWRQSDFTKAA